MPKRETEENLDLKYKELLDEPESTYVPAKQKKQKLVKTTTFQNIYPT